MRLGGLLGHAGPGRRGFAIGGGRGSAGDSGADLDPGVSAGAIARGGAGSPGAGPQSRAASAAPGHSRDRSRTAGSPRAGSGELGGLPGKGGCAVRRPDLRNSAPGPQGLGSAPSRRSSLAQPPSPSGSWLRWAVGAASGPQRGCHRPHLCGGRRARLESRAHREPLAPPAAASGHAESAPRSARVTAMVKWKGGWGTGVRGRPQWPSGPLGLWPGEQAPSGSGQRWPVPSRDPWLILACPDFVPLCSVQEKLWKYTRIARPLARVSLPQEKQPSYPTWWSADAGALAGC